MDNLSVVRLDEQSLRRIKDKLEKLRVEKPKETTTPRKPAARTPKFEVYRPGVTRLSNRNISFEASPSPRSPAKSSTRDSPENTSSRNKSDVKRKERKPRESAQNRRDEERPQSRYKARREEGKGRNGGRAGEERNKNWRKPEETKKSEPPEESSTSGDSYDDEEEGFLARHERRRRRRGYESRSSASEHEELKPRNGSNDDEFIWDDYHGDFLKNWQPNDSFSISTVSDEVTIPTEYEESETKQTQQRTTKEADKKSFPKPDTDRSIDSEPFAHGDRSDKTGKNRERGLIKRATEPVAEEPQKDTRKQLFNPDNPEIPIMVRPNVRDKKVRAKAVAPEPSHGVKQTRRHSTPHLYSPQENCRSHEPVSKKYNPTIPDKYTSHPDHWTAPVPIDYPDFDQDRNVDHDDVISSGVGDRLSEESNEKLLKDAEALEAVINNFVSNRQLSTKVLNEKTQISRTQLKQIYKSLILHHIEISTKHNVEQLLWKTVYHQFMERLRKGISSSAGDEKNDLKNLLIVVLDQATEFYENLLMRLQRMYKINLKELFSNVSSMKQFQKRIGKRTKLALMTCQRSLICLGDISRYKENANETSNFGRARQYYMQARNIEPRNGRPFNQLALLALHTRRKLDALYYYTRSLSTIGNPILTARESLIALFDDARRKYQKWEEGTVKDTKVSEPAKEDPNLTRRRASMKHPRIIWLLPGEEEIAESSDEIIVEEILDEKSSETSPISSMSQSQLFRHFILVFTHVHGKLFTRVGLDSFEKLKQQLLELFEKVLCDETINKQTLQYLFAINFFTVFDQQQRVKTEPSGATSTWLSVQALQLALAMISIMTRQITIHLNQLPIQRDQYYDPTLSRQLSTLLPSVKISNDWMYSNKALWYPKPPPQPTNPQHDVWASLAELSDWLIGDYKAFPMRIFNQNHHNREEVCLSEDFELSGFAPLSNVDYETRYVLISDFTSAEQRDRACDCVRLDLIRDFLEYLCGMEDPLLAFKQGRYVVLVESAPVYEELKQRLSSAEEISTDMLEDTSIHDDIIVEEDPRNDDADMSELKNLRNSLQQTKYDHDRRKDQINASLEAHTDKQDIYVKPQNLIPDTNCFIDHLPHISALLDTRRFTVYVPLVVLTELQGLSQDSKGDDEHAMKVYSKASAAEEFLQRKFSKERDVKLQALTNQGSILSTISFRSQSDAGNKASNDDLILQCCIKFEEKLSKQSKQALRTVLLSDDRNLRVKALARNMPTKALPEFCKWANVGKS